MGHHNINKIKFTNCYFKENLIIPIQIYVLLLRKIFDFECLFCRIFYDLKNIAICDNLATKLCLKQYHLVFFQSFFPLIVVMEESSHPPADDSMKEIHVFQSVNINITHV